MSKRPDPHLSLPFQQFSGAVPEFALCIK